MTAVSPLAKFLGQALYREHILLFCPVPGLFWSSCFIVETIIGRFQVKEDGE
jgi:hypothetical protein